MIDVARRILTEADINRRFVEPDPAMDEQDDYDDDDVNAVSFNISTLNIIKSVLERHSINLYFRIRHNSVNSIFIHTIYND